jgi:hypothetical protein
MHAAFRIIRLLDNQLIASNCIIDCSIDILPTSNPSNAKDRIKAMRLWIEEYLDGALAFGINTNANTETFESIGNQIMMCPDDPHDYLLLLLIHSKLDAIGGSGIVVSKTNLISDTGEGFSNSVEGTAEDWLPVNSQWIGEPAYHDRPWWHRDDSSTVDMKYEEGEDITDVPELGINLIELVGQKQPSPDNEQPLAEIVKPAFKPRVLTLDD